MDVSRARRRRAALRSPSLSSDSGRVAPGKLFFFLDILAHAFCFSRASKCKENVDSVNEQLRSFARLSIDVSTLFA
jgi:hypothetical protein